MDAVATILAGLMGLFGVAAGAMIAAQATRREQEYSAKLLVLEKRIEAHSKLFKALYEILTCVHRKQLKSLPRPIGQFRAVMLDTLFYLDKITKAKVLAVYAFVMPILDGHEFEVGRLVDLINDTNRKLFEGLGIDYV